MISEFLPLAPLDAAEFADPLEALSSVDDEIFYLPEYYYWDLTTPTVVGCPFGGSFSFESSAAGENLAFSNCAFSDGFVITGRGIYDYNAGLFFAGGRGHRPKGGRIDLHAGRRRSPHRPGHVRGRAGGSQTVIRRASPRAVQDTWRVGVFASQSLRC